MSKVKEGISPEIAAQVLVRSGLKKPVVVACIPAYNEEGRIGPVVVRTKALVDRVLVCDDGSTDLTTVVSEGLGATVIRHDRNRGKGAAMRTLFELAQDLKPDIVVVLDADSQHDPQDIPRLVLPIVNGEADFVIGSRFAEGGVSDAPLYRRLGQWLFNSASSYNGLVRDTQSGFRAFSPRALAVVSRADSNGFGVETEQLDLAFKTNMRIKEVPVNIKYSGVDRPSKKNPLLHGSEIISTLIRLVAEERPLLLLGIPAALLVVIGSIAGVSLLWEYNNVRVFSIPLALIGIAGVGMGMFLGLTALILYAINRLKPKR